MKAAPESVNARVRQVVGDLKRYKPLQIILFGSTARGDADAYSDLDFVVIKQTDQPFLIPTRYPDALAFPGLPYESYTERQTKEAVKLAGRIVNVVKQKLH